MTYLIKGNLRKTLFFLSVCVIYFFSNVLYARAQNLNFSGTWNLNRTKTDFGELSENSAPIELTISQKKDTIIIERVSKNGNKELNTYIEKLTFDGKVCESTIKSTKKFSILQWSTDGKMLIEKADYRDENSKIQYRGTETWILSNAGSPNLIINRVDSINGTCYSKKMVYDRQ